MTSRETFDQVNEETGATIITRGTYKQSDAGSGDSLSPDDKPLHLYVTADSQEKVDKACSKLKTLMERPSTTPSGLLMNKVYISFAADADPSFSLPGKIIGPSGSFVKHIQTASGCKVHLRGKGSSYMEANTRQEAQEALHLFITGPTAEQVQHAKNLSEQLIASVKRKYDAFLADRRSGFHQSSSSSSNENSHSNRSPHPHHHHQYQQPSTPSSSYDSTTTTPQYTPQRSPSGTRSSYTPHSDSNFSSSSSSKDLRPPAPPPPPPRGPSPAPPTMPHHETHGDFKRADMPPHGQSPAQQVSSRKDDYRPPVPQHSAAPSSHPTSQLPSAGIDYSAQQAMAAAAYGYAEWTPEAIAAYYAYYGIPVPNATATTSQFPQASNPPPPSSESRPGAAPRRFQENSTSAATAPPAPPPSLASSHASSLQAQEMEMEMDMSDDDEESEYIVTAPAKGKRSYEDSNADPNNGAKKPKYEEQAVQSKPAPPSTDKPFWASTTSNRSNVLAPSARQPDH
jgi:hypothetical protein